MSKLKGFTTLSNLKTVEELSRYYSIVVDEIKAILNGKISFSENVEVSSVSVTFTSAGTEVIVNHTLQVIPIGYVVIGRDSDFTVYDGITSWTAQYISLRASASGNARILVIV